LVGETVAGYSNVLFMFGFAVLALAPALVISRMISPRTKSNPVKFLPMECGQVPSGAGRTHDAILCLHPNVCYIRCNGYLLVRMG